jgi:hypothetical protein
MPVIEGATDLQRQGRDDDGVVIALLALVLVVLMGLAAIAVDIGSAYAVRRQDQGAVDTATLAAAIQGRVGSGYTGMVQTIKDVVAKNSPAPITDANWAACTDPDHLPIASTTVTSIGSPCISFGYQKTTDAQPTGITQIRVRLPDVAVPTVFGGIFGVKAINTHALAVAEIRSPFEFPSGLFADASAGSQICLLNGSSGNGGLCNSNVSGAFGLFNPYYYSIAGCPSGGGGSGGNGPGLAIAQGVDHQLFPLKASPTDPTQPDLTLERDNGASGCTEYFPNTVTNNQGFTNQDIAAGLVQGDTGQHNPSGLPYRGRLSNGPYWNGGPSGNLNSATIGGLPMDDVPIWYFLAPLATLTAHSAPLECRVAQQMSPKRDQLVTTAFNSSLGLTVNTTTAALTALEVNNGLSTDGVTPLYSSPEDIVAACLSKWTENVGPIFTKSIATTLRLTSVPRYWENASSTGNNHIRYFQPLYIDAAALKDNGNAARTGAVAYAGDPVSSTNSAWNGGNFANSFAGVVGMAVPCDTMPASICKTQDGLAGSGSIGQVWLVQ